MTRLASAKDRRRVAWYVKNFPHASVYGISVGLSMEESLVQIALRDLHESKKLDGFKVKGFTPYPPAPQTMGLFR